MKNKKTNNLEEEIKRYSIMDYYKKHPYRLSDINKEYLGDVYSRVYDIFLRNFPIDTPNNEKIDKSCQETLNAIFDNLLSKLNSVQ